MAIDCSARELVFCQTLLPMETSSRRKNQLRPGLYDRSQHGRLNESEGGNVSKDINVVALVKGEERYIFLFNDGQKSETLRTLGKYASDSKLSFSWYDAAVLSQKVRNIEQAKTSCNFEGEGESLNRNSDVPNLFPESQFGHEEDLFSPDSLFPEEDWF